MNFVTLEPSSAFSNVIDSKLEEIGEFYLKNDTDQSYGLYGGGGGVVLFLAMYYKLTNDERYFDRLCELIDQINDNIDASGTFTVPLSSGLAGWGWLIEFLKDEGLIEEESTGFLNQLDIYLEQNLDVFISQNKLDPLHEGLGLALYFLRRNRYDPVKRVLNALYRTREDTGGETKWKQFDRFTNNWEYNFGLAHGPAGYLAFFTECYKRSILPEQCLELIEGVLRYFDHNRQDISVYRSYFPSKKLVEDYSPNEQHHTSRLGWCYGDLTVLYTFLNTAIVTHDTILESKVIGMLRETAARKTVADTNVQDAGFCHGTSGIAFIFNKLYQKTPLEIFRQTSDHWCSATLALANMKGDEGICGYLFKTGTDSWEAEPGFLTGLAGVGLSLIAARSPALGTWSEAVYLL